LPKDILNREQRSWVMSRIRGKNTKPELAVRSALHCAGYRFRLHRSDLPGKPDIVLSRYHTVIFVNGCFWHQHHGCEKATIPQYNRQFWQKKLERTVQRDQQNGRKLRRLGWRVVTLWECRIRDSIDNCVERVGKRLA